tara:strand:+ start:509 stop:793 length:285 start_codon:yes stop_codon:yes gene_type:complete
MSIERKELLIELMSISDIDELKLIRSAINDRIKEVGYRVKYTLSKGDVVIVTSKSGVEQGTIIKVNRTRAVVNLDGKGAYNVPFSMITKQGGSV